MSASSHPAPERLVPRWSDAPGWNALLDRAEAIVRKHEETAGHEPNFYLRSKGLIDTWGDCCLELDGLLFQEIEQPSASTCALCGQSGRQWPEAPDYKVRCHAHFRVSFKDYQAAL